MNLIAAWRKRSALRSYVRNLPRMLRRDYGASRSYTPHQIRSTISRCGLNPDYSCYGVAMFADRATFDEYHRSLGEDCDYDAMRNEVAGLLFRGDPDLASLDGSAGPLQGIGSSAHGHHCDGGGHSHGHDGGH